MQYERLRIYHEHQSSQLCARHCLNNLLQGPYFTEFDLSKIALQLDKEEQQLLAQDGDENAGLIEWLKTNQQSQNVSDDGNFSIQVLRRALDNLGLGIFHFGNKEISDAQQHPENEQGFICNLQAHWFAIRRIGGQWYNLNSLSGLPETKAKPTTLGSFYLSAFLSTLANDGYSIFVIRSDTWPHLHSYDPQQLLPPYAKWYLHTDIKDRSETYPKHLLEQVNKSRNGQNVTALGAWGGNNTFSGGNNNGGATVNLSAMTQEEQLQYAMMQSAATNNNNTNNNNNGNNMANEDPELAHALAISMNAYNENKNNNNNNNNGNAMNVDDEDTLLAQALAMSMEQDNDNDKTNNENENTNTNESNPKEEEVDDKKMEIVEEPPLDDDNACIIQLRLPQNKKIERRFKKEHKLGDVSNFVKSEDSSFTNIIFVCPPMDSFNDMDMSLEEICKKLNAKKLSFIVKENANKE
eukprot:CAMPEP_0201567108 /NCGR_PEP_ID=MMETSP0190_2-20130828/7414_1 /ASSEMBLY_ACC=CAM_ASM_000263 /TAXON_ID=37353 /ORGANISM="Rosalina sp." /LENGTH=465 /DNA_ID=CAMNT_0047986693 /DNA_START=53 /DNA_END=1450 /DNA_ORIENTATION=+